MSEDTVKYNEATRSGKITSFYMGRSQAGLQIGRASCRGWQLFYQNGMMMMMLQTMMLMNWK